MQDLHSLRYARQDAVKAGVDASTARRKAAERTRGVPTVGADGGAVTHAIEPNLVEAAMAAVPVAGDDKLRANSLRCIGAT